MHRLFGMPGAPGKTEAVYGDGGDPILLHLELDTGMDGAALIFGDGKDGAADQLLQLALGDPDGTAGVDVGQFGLIFGRLGGDGKGSVAGTDGDLEAVVHHHGDGTLRQTADNVAEEPGGEDAFAGVGDLRFDLVGNGGFHIIAGQVQTHTCLAEDTLDDGKTALLSNSPACNIQALDQHAFFTGKTHSQFPFVVK